MKNSIKKYNLIVVMMCFMLGMTGCCLNHEYTEATCTAPAECKKCGELSGEALGHDYVAATCIEAGKCSRCGEENEPALGHEYGDDNKCIRCGIHMCEEAGHQANEATYWEEGICSVCNEVVNEKLIPQIEDKYHITKIDNKKVFTSHATEDDKLEVKGKASIEISDVFEEKKGYAKEDGYVWQTGEVKIVFEDKNSVDKGASFNIAIEDNYYPVERDESEKYDKKNNLESYSVLYKNEKYDKCIYSIKNKSQGWKGDKYEVIYSFAFRVPFEYDGTIIAIYDSAIDYDDKNILEADLDGEKSVIYLLPSAVIAEEKEE